LPKRLYFLLLLSFNKTEKRIRAERCAVSRVIHHSDDYFFDIRQLFVTRTDFPSLHLLSCAFTRGSDDGLGKGGRTNNTHNTHGLIRHSLSRSHRLTTGEATNINTNKRARRKRKKRESNGGIYKTLISS
jgi:hypothetical protein